MGLGGESGAKHLSEVAQHERAPFRTIGPFSGGRSKRRMEIEQYSGEGCSAMRPRTLTGVWGVFVFGVAAARSVSAGIKSAVVSDECMYTQCNDQREGGRARTKADSSDAASPSRRTQLLFRTRAAQPRSDDVYAKRDQESPNHDSAEAVMSRISNCGQCPKILSSST